MRKLPLFLLPIILLVSVLSSSAYAQDALDKLTRGMLNILVSPLELLQSIGDAYSEHDIAVAFPMGIFWGTVNTVKRATVGAFEIVTFPLPMPADYGPIIEEPVFLEKKAEKEKEAKANEAQAEEAETKEEPASDEEFPVPGM